MTLLPIILVCIIERVRVFRRGLQVPGPVGGHLVPVRYPAVDRGPGQPIQHQGQVRGL